MLIATQSIDRASRPREVATRGNDGLTNRSSPQNVKMKTVAQNSTRFIGPSTEKIDKSTLHLSGGF